jgi:transglutaminase-like putative cysteine protease
MTAVVGAVSQDYFPLTTTIVAPAAIVLGFVVSWRRRKRANIGLKAVLSVLLLSVTVWFFYIMAVEPYDTRVPLAELFLWIQVLHSFDLPARRDLNFSLIAALVLLSMAGTLAYDALFLVYPLVFAVFALAGLFLMHTSEAGADLRDSTGRSALTAILKSAVGIAAALAVVSTAAYAVTPRLPGMKVQSLPFSAERLVQSAFKGGFTGGTDIALDRRLPMSQAVFSGSAYPGFSQELDLRVRGKLSDTIMMRVRATYPAYHRALVFDTYAGNGWTRSPGKPVKVTERDGRPPIVLQPLDQEGAMGARETTSSYYIAADQENFVFASYQTVLLYFPAAAVWQDKNSAVTSSFSLEKDMVYSAVSNYEPPDPARLRRMPGVKDPAPFETYLKLPDLPARVEKFAAGLAPDKNPYEQLEAIQNALWERCVYDTTGPFQPEDADSVDFFLFGSRRGSCDHYASAFVVLARLKGIPARLVTGYAPGDYNPFTGFYEVRALHAHAWAEAYIPNYGWIQFDPTPGSEVETAGQDRGMSMMFGALAKYLRERWSGIPWVDALRARLAAAGGLWPYFAVPGLLMAALIWLLRRRKGKHQVLAERYDQGRLAVLYGEVLAELEAGGMRRSPAATPAEFADSIAALPYGGDFAVLTRLFERAFYGREELGEEEEELADEAAASVKTRLKRPSG